MRTRATLMDEAQRRSSLAGINEADALRIGCDGFQELGELAHKLDDTECSITVLVCLRSQSASQKRGLLGRRIRASWGSSCH